MPAPETPATTKFPHRARRGILLGLTAAQLVITTIGGLILLAALMTGGIPAALELIPVWAAFAALVLIRYRGRPIANWTPIVLRYLARRVGGQLQWLAHPGRRPSRRGLLHLPGTAASLRAYTSSDGMLGAVHDPHRRTLTAVLRVSSRAFALLDPDTQESNVEGWGRTLASLARSGKIARIQVLERTVPDSGDALNRYWATHRAPDTELASGIYQDMLAAAGPAAAPHEAYLAISLDCKEARRLITQAGGGLSGAFHVLAQLASSADQAVRNCGLTPAGWLTAPQIAAVVRTAYDPKALVALDRWSATGRPEADLAAAGPVVLVEEADRIRTDTAWHAVFWVENWPRTETGFGFLHQLLFTAGIRRSLSLTYTPQRLDAAFRDVRRRKSTVVADAAERARKGQVEAEEDSIEYADIKARERQLIAGHADVALTGLLTVSADSSEALDTACALIETSAVAAMVDLRRLDLQHAEAFTTAALPLARP